MASVVGADQELSIDDDIEDVLYFDYETLEEHYTSEHPNIDIEKVTAIQDDKKVELQLKLMEDGKIQNSDFIFYEIILITSLNVYDVYYTSGECIAYDTEYNEISEADCSGVGTRTLIVSFDLLSGDEECQLLQAVTYEVTMVGDGNYYMDMAPNWDFLTVDAGTTYEGYVGESIEFSGSVEDGSPPYNWSWDFGDGNISYGQNPTYVYNKDGTYEVTLIVSDVNGIFGYGLANVTIYPAEDGNGGNDSPSSDTDKSDSSDSGLLLFGAVITLIFIIGVAVIVYIIRR